MHGHVITISTNAEKPGEMEKGVIKSSE